MLRLMELIYRFIITTKKNSVAAVVLALFFSTPLLAQTDTLTIQQKVQQVSVDPFSNIYLLTDNFEFQKYNSKGVLEYKYSDLQLSELSKIASDHTFKSMIYYPEYGFIRVFGNRLQQLAEINLNNLGYGEVTAVAPSIGFQSFWVFDATDQKLVRINQNGMVELESELQNILDEPFFPDIIKEREGWVYAYDDEKGLYIFDNTGIFSKIIPITDANSFSVLDGKIFISKAGKIYQVETYLKTLQPINVSIEGEIIALAFRQMIIQNKGFLQLVKF